MEYMLMFYQPNAEFDAREATTMGAWMAYVQAIRAAGVVRAGHGLTPPATATTLRVRGTERLVQDGPFADAKEQLGGYFVIEVPDLDAALAWAERAPCASTGGVEVRPVFTAPTM